MGDLLRGIGANKLEGRLPRMVKPKWDESVAAMRE